MCMNIFKNALFQFILAALTPFYQQDICASVLENVSVQAGSSTAEGPEPKRPFHPRYRSDKRPLPEEVKYHLSKSTFI